MEIPLGSFWELNLIGKCNLNPKLHSLKFQLVNKMKECLYSDSDELVCTPMLVSTTKMYFKRTNKYDYVSLHFRTSKSHFKKL